MGTAFTCAVADWLMRAREVWFQLPALSDSCTHRGVIFIPDFLYFLLRLPKMGVLFVDCRSEGTVNILNALYLVVVLPLHAASS